MQATVEIRLPGALIGAIVATSFCTTNKFSEIGVRQKHTLRAYSHLGFETILRFKVEVSKKVEIGSGFPLCALTRTLRLHSRKGAWSALT